MELLSQAFPVILQALALGLKWFGAKQDTIEAFKNLIIASHDDGLISAETRDVFIQQQQELLKGVHRGAAPGRDSSPTAPKS